MLRLAQLCAAKKVCTGRNYTLSSLIRNTSAEQGCRDSIRMQRSRFADAKPGRTLHRLTTLLRSRCALIGQDRVKAEVQRAGDSPREVPSSSVLCKTHTHTHALPRAHARTHTTILSPAFGIFVSQDWTALVSKQIGIFNSYSNEGKTTVAQSRRGGPCGRRRCSSPPVE